MRVTTPVAAIVAAAICVTPGRASAQAQATRTISGAVVDATNAPVANATVTVKGSAVSVVTGADGSFKLDGAPTGELVLVITADGFTAVELPVIASPTGQTVSATLSPAVPPPTTRQLAGQVKDPTGKPVAGAAVSVPGTQITAITDENGEFVLSGVPEGEVQLSVQAKGLAPVARVAGDAASVAIELAPSTRTLKGKVTDSSGSVVAGAMVQLPGTDVLAFTDENGRFELPDVPLDARSLNVEAVGYRTIPLPIVDGDLHAVMPREAAGKTVAQGEEIFIEGRAPVISKENKTLGASVVDGRDLNRVSAQTLDGALIGKVAGANIQANSGAPGGGIQLRLRGISTINGASSPLFVVDGVIMSNSAVGSGVDAITDAGSASQENAVNRIADLNPNDIENVEILKGASAAALYGSKASNGVVIITTRRGKQGVTKVEVTQRVGVSQVSNSLGSRKFNSAQEVMDAFGDPDLAALWTPTTYDHEKAMTQTPLGYETVASASGGTENGNYAGSILVRDEPGVVKNTFYEKQSGRLSVGYKIGDLRLGVSTNVIHSKSDRGLSNNDNSGASPYMALAATPSFVDLSADGSGMFPNNPRARANPLQTVALVSNEEEVLRAIGSANADYKVWSNQNHSFSMRGNFGVDRFQQRNNALSPNILQFEPDDGLPGTAVDATTNNLNYNINVGGAWTFEPTSKDWKSGLSAGLTYEVADRDSLFVVSRGLNPFQPTPGEGAMATETTRGVLLAKDQGFYIQEEAELLDSRLSLVGAMLFERSSLNGESDQFYLFPKLAAAYKLPVAESVFDTLRVRAAYGETGNRPTYGQKFTPLVADPVIDGQQGLVLGGVAGDPGIEPERQREVEIGTDAILHDQRLSVEVSVYQRDISNLLLRRTLAPTTGFSVQNENGAELRNRGVDLTVSALPIDFKTVDWKMTGTLTLNRSEITHLPHGPFNDTNTGFGAGFGAFRLEEGKSATQIVSDVDGDGILDVVGDGEPDYRVGFGNELTVGPFGLFALLDWQQGSEVINMTRMNYDENQVSADYTTAGMERHTALENGDVRPYIEDASFVKVREISLSYNLPTSVARLIGPVDRMQLSLSGRNLYTFTNYSGLDPEVSNFGSQSIGRNFDLAPYPPSRSVWLSVTAGF